MRFEDYFDFDAVMEPLWGGKRHRRHRRRGRTRRKWFERGDLKFAILALIEEKPMHGYEVMQALEEESAGCYKASAGSVYPTLQLLEDQEFVSAQERDGKKVYTITDAGRAYLDKNRDHVDHIFERFNDFSDRIFGRDMSELYRSFSRLAQTTFQGAVGWVDDEELLSEMKDILNRAVTDMDSAWDEAAKRRRAAREKRRSRRSGDASAEAGASADAHAATSHADDTESTDEDAQD